MRLKIFSIILILLLSPVFIFKSNVSYKIKIDKPDYFKIWFTFISATEGTYANRSAKEDPGGETMRGITLYTYKNICKSVLKRKYKYEDFRNLKKSDVAKIAKIAFWDEFDRFNDKRLTLLFAYSFWGGGGYQLVMDLQYILNLSQDGVLGAQTYKKANQSKDNLYHKLVIKRTNYLRTLPNYRYNPGWEKVITFLKKLDK